jgi:hypothetical protein
MLVKQISVFTENKPGQAFEPIKALAAAGIDLCAVSIADTNDFGILRMITRSNEKAISVLKDAGFTINVSELIGVVVENTPGGLSAVLSIFEKENINIEYFYSFMPRENEEAIMFFKVEETPAAIEKLLKSDIKLCDAKITRD